jgi:hypothetical protein
MDADDNSGVVLRNLSCMCIFIPRDVQRQYGENHQARMQRMENMREGLRRLQERGELFHRPEGSTSAAEKACAISSTGSFEGLSGSDEGDHSNVAADESC